VAECSDSLSQHLHSKKAGRSCFAALGTCCRCSRIPGLLGGRSHSRGQEVDRPEQMDSVASTSGAAGRTELDLTNHHLPDLSNQEISASLTVRLRAAVQVLCKCSGSVLSRTTVRA
jgi:hypothetical protein